MTCFIFKIGLLKTLNNTSKDIRLPIGINNYGYVNKINRLPIVDDYLIGMRYSKLKYNAL